MYGERQHRAPEFYQFLGEAGRSVLHAGSYGRIAATPSLAEAHADSALQPELERTDRTHEHQKQRKHNLQLAER